MTRIHWTNLEMTIVAKKAAFLLKCEPYTHLFKAVDKAQKDHLPSDRQRTMKGDAHCRTIMPFIQKELKSLEGRIKSIKKPAPPVEVKKAPVTDLEKSISNLQDALTVSLLEIFKPVIDNVALNIKKELSKSIKGMLDDVISSAAEDVVKDKKVFHKLTGKVTATTDEPNAKNTTDNELVSKTVDTVKQKVVVLGLWNGTGFKVKDKRYDNLDVTYCQDLSELRNLNVPDSAILVQAVKSSPQLPLGIQNKFNEIVQSHGEYSNICYHLNDLNVRYK